MNLEKQTILNDYAKNKWKTISCVFEMDDIGLNFLKFICHLGRTMLMQAKLGGKEDFRISIQSLSQCFCVYPSQLDGNPRPLPSALWGGASARASCLHSSCVYLGSKRVRRKQEGSKGSSALCPSSQESLDRPQVISSWNSAVFLLCVVCMQVSMHVSAQVEAGWGGCMSSSVILYLVPFRQGLLLNLGWAVLVGLAGQWAPRDHLFPGRHSHAQFFTQVPGIWTQVLMITQQVLCPQRAMSQPLSPVLNGCHVLTWYQHARNFWIFF